LNSWPLIPLDEIADVSAGNPAPQDPSHFSDDGHPFVRMQDVGRVHVSPNMTETFDRITDAAVRQGGLRLYPKGTLLVPKSGASVNLNHRAMLGRAAYVVSHLATIIPDWQRVDPSYLFYWSMVYDPRKQAQVTSLPSLPLSLIKAALVPIPPLDEQRRIVGLLDRAAEIRRRADAARAKARAIIPALFLDTFGDPATNPKGWPTAELGRHADVQGGVQVSAKRAALPVELPYLRVANVMRGRLDLTEIKMIRVTASEALRTNLVPGDVLVVEGHGNPNEIGRAAVWDGSITTCTHQNHLIRVRPGLGSLTPEYVETFLNSDVGRRILIHNGKTTSGLNTISTRNVKEVRIPLPPTGLQSVFAEQIQRIEALARHLDAAAAKAEAMAAGLSAEVFG
jgi:type I restriction enzyme S subunit